MFGGVPGCCLKDLEFGLFITISLIQNSAPNDLALRFDAELGAGWTATVAYALQQWSGVRQGLRFIDNVGQSTAIPVEEDVLFEGPLIGIQYTF